MKNKYQEMDAMSAFCSELWPEETTPEAYKDCRECGLYKHGSRMVWGEGNPIVCGTRQTLQQAASEVGMKMDYLYVTFILKRRPVRAYEKEQTREICMIHLKEQIEQKRPKIILCLGNVAVQSVFRDPKAEVKNMRGTWHVVDGYQTAVAYHPLAVRRRPHLWNMFLRDMAFVAERLR
jgi:uracil-DNA glycosylase